MRFRYVLHLQNGEHDEIVRHVSVQPLETGSVLTIRGKGEWRIVNLVRDGEGVFNNGIAYCEPAKSDGADEHVLTA